MIYSGKKSILLTARLCLLSSTVLVGLEVYAPNMVTSYTSVDGKTLKMYLTKLLAISGK